MSSESEPSEFIPGRESKGTRKPVVIIFTDQVLAGCFYSNSVYVGNIGQLPTNCVYKISIKGLEVHQVYFPNFSFVGMDGQVAIHVFLKKFLSLVCPLQEKEKAVVSPFHVYLLLGTGDFRRIERGGEVIDKFVAGMKFFQDFLLAYMPGNSFLTWCGFLKYQAFEPHVSAASFRLRKWRKEVVQGKQLAFEDIMGGITQAHLPGGKVSIAARILVSEGLLRYVAGGDRKLVNINKPRWKLNLLDQSTDIAKPGKLITCPEMIHEDDQTGEKLMEGAQENPPDVELPPFPSVSSHFLPTLDTFSEENNSQEISGMAEVGKVQGESDPLLDSTMPVYTDVSPAQPAHSGEDNEVAAVNIQGDWIESMIMGGSYPYDEELPYASLMTTPVPNPPQENELNQEEMEIQGVEDSSVIPVSLPVLEQMEPIERMEERREKTIVSILAEEKRSSYQAMMKLKNKIRKKTTGISRFKLEPKQKASQSIPIDLSLCPPGTSKEVEPVKKLGIWVPKKTPVHEPDVSPSQPRYRYSLYEFPPRAHQNNFK